MAFRATDAAVEGFRIIRREPKTVAGWAVATVGISVVMYGLMFALGVPSMLTPAAGMPPEQVLSAMGPLFGFMALAGILVIGIYAVAICAVYRAVLRPQETGWARLRLGADEGRMALLMIILWLLFVAAYIVVVIVAVIAAAVLGVGAAMSGGNNSGGAIGGAILAAVVFFCAVIAFFIWLGVQFSMAGPKTFAERRLSVFSSWGLVKGHFWPLLGCFFLNWVIVIALYIVFGALQSIPMLMLGLSTPFSTMFNPQAAPDMAAYFTPGYLVIQLISSVVSAIMYPIMIAPAAAAYRDIVGLSAPAQADVFS